MQRRPRRQPSGAPVACGMCHKGLIAGLMFEGKKANQALSPVAGGSARIHVDRRLCKALEKYEEKPSGRTTFVPKDEVGSDRDVGQLIDLSPVGPVGPSGGDDGKRPID